MVQLHTEEWNHILMKDLAMATRGDVKRRGAASWRFVTSWCGANSFIKNDLSNW